MFNALKLSVEVLIEVLPEVLAVVLAEAIAGQEDQVGQHRQREQQLE